MNFLILGQRALPFVIQSFELELEHELEKQVKKIKKSPTSIILFVRYKRSEKNNGRQWQIIGRTEGHPISIIGFLFSLEFPLNKSDIEKSRRRRRRRRRRREKKRRTIGLLYYTIDRK